MNTLEAYKLNKSAILAALRAAGATAATVTYAGDSDDGGVEDMIVEGLPDQSAAGPLLATPIVETMVSYPWDPLTGCPSETPVVSTRESRVDTALENLAWHAVGMAGRDGWENGGGGGGEFTLDVASGTTTLDHYDNYTEQVHCAWSEPSEDPETEAV